MIKMKTKKIGKKRAIVVSAIAVAVLGLGYGAYRLYANTLPAKPNTTSDRGVNSVDYSGPTKDEAAAGDQQKEKNAERQKIDNTPTSSAANIVLTDSSVYDGVVETRAYVSNIYENGGTCTATFTREGQDSIEVTSNSFADATTTQCGALNIPVTKFNSGPWSVTVSYKSSTSAGKSTATTVTIP